MKKANQILPFFVNDNSWTEVTSCDKLVKLITQTYGI